MSADSWLSMRASSASGYGQWCTLRSLSAVAPTRLRYMTSARNGITGAINLLSVSSTAYSVWYAASLSAPFSFFQKRRRLRRMYQLLSRSSTNFSAVRQNAMTLKPSKDSRALRTSSCRSERIQRSMSGRSDSGTGGALRSNSSYRA
jgi:hypothetical protein